MGRAKGYLSSFLPAHPVPRKDPDQLVSAGCRPVRFIVLKGKKNLYFYVKNIVLAFEGGISGLCLAPVLFLLSENVTSQVQIHCRGLIHQTRSGRESETGTGFDKSNPYHGFW